MLSSRHERLRTRERKMRLSGWLAIVTLGFCISAASPMWAKNGVTELQKQGPYTQSKLYQMAAAGASIGRIILVPGRPVLKVDSGTCQEKINRWNDWHRICLKECEDIAAAYTFKSNNNSSTSLSYQREFNACLDGCNSKFKYYMKDIC